MGLVADEMRLSDRDSAAGGGERMQSAFLNTATRKKDDVVPKNLKGKALNCTSKSRKTAMKRQ